MIGMSVNVGYVVAFGGGVISFLSPCVLPLVPAYLSVVTGIDSSGLRDGGPQEMMRVTKYTALFILGFAIVFVSLGATASELGRALTAHHALITRISGVFLIAMSLFLLGSMLLKLPWMYQERRFHPNLSKLGVFAAPVAGMAFAFGWTPCIGPILSSVLTVAATQGKLTQGAMLLAAYSAGLGIPFLATGLAFGKATNAFTWVKRHFNTLTTVSAVILLGFGILLTMNRFTIVTLQLQHLMQSVGLGRLITIG